MRAYYSDQWYDLVREHNPVQSTHTTQTQDFATIVAGSASPTSSPHRRSRVEGLRKTPSLPEIVSLSPGERTSSTSLAEDRFAVSLTSPTCKVKIQTFVSGEPKQHICIHSSFIFNSFFFYLSIFYVLEFCCFTLTCEC